MPSRATACSPRPYRPRSTRASWRWSTSGGSGCARRWRRSSSWRTKGSPCTRRCRVRFELRHVAYRDEYPTTGEICLARRRRAGARLAAAAIGVGHDLPANRRRRDRRELAPAATGRVVRSRPRATPSTAASWRARSTPFAASTRVVGRDRRAHRRPHRRRRPRRVSVAPGDARSSARYRGRRRAQVLVLDAGPGLPAAAAAARGLRPAAHSGTTRADYLHTLVEAAKLAFADRERWYGDPEFADVPLERLLSDGYADERRAADRPRARPRRSSGRATSDPWRSPSVTPDPRAGNGDTTHVDVADDAGQPVRGNAERRLARVVADHPGARLPARVAAPGVQPGPVAPERARAGQASAHDAHTVARHARRAAVDGLRDAGRRPAGPVDAAVLPERRRLRDGPPGGDRRAAGPHARTSRRRSTRTRCSRRLVAESRIGADVLDDPSGAGPRRVDGRTTGRAARSPPCASTPRPG